MVTDMNKNRTVNKESERKITRLLKKNKTQMIQLHKLMKFVRKYIELDRNEWKPGIRSVFGEESRGKHVNPNDDMNGTLALAVYPVQGLLSAAMEYLCSSSFLFR